MTIKEVADLAGVSPAAVSRYLNGGPLSKEKKKVIEDTIQKTGYQPNIAAQVMRTGRVNQVGVLVPKVDSEAVSQVLSGITSELQHQGYLPVLGCYDSKDEKEIEFLHAMEKNQVAGVVVMAMDLTKKKREVYQNLPFPVVFTGQNFQGFSCVYHDDYHLMAELMTRMIAKGRTRIAYIGAYEKDLQAGEARRRGAEMAYMKKGFKKENLIREIVDFSVEEGYEATQKILREHPEVDGILCASDIIAIGAIEAIREAGRCVGKDIGIGGVDDFWMDRFIEVPLTSAHLYFQECGLRAAGLLLEQMKGDAATQQICLDFSIIDRGSL
jgi:LacI family sucrose operon transcriptional repressor